MINFEILNRQRRKIRLDPFDELAPIPLVLLDESLARLREGGGDRLENRLCRFMLVVLIELIIPVDHLSNLSQPIKLTRTQRQPELSAFRGDDYL